MEMIWSGDWLTPTIHGIPYYNKPPLFNWLLNINFALFQSFDEWVVRLPALISFFTTAFFLFLFVRKEEDSNQAILSVLALLTMADILFYGAINSGEIDLTFSLIVSIQIWSIYFFGSREKWFMMFLFSYGFCAIAFLTKGPPALAFQALSLLTYMIYTKNWKKLFRLKHISGILLFLVLVGTYFYLYDQQNGKALVYIRNLFSQAGEKVGSEKSFIDRFLVLMVFPIEFIKISLPWSLALVLLLFRGIRKLWTWTPLTKFAALMLIMNIPLYWIGAKFVARYLYMFLPFVAVLSAHILNKLYNTYPSLIRRVVSYISIIFILLLTSLFFLVRNDFAGLINYFSYKLVLGILLLVGLNILLNRRKLTPYLGLAFALLAMRLLFNLFYLPYIDNELTYREEALELREMCGNQTIHLQGKTTDVLLPKFGPMEESEFKRPPLIPYQIPYYLGKIQYGPVVLDATMERKWAYLTHNAANVSENHKVVWEFRDEWQNRDLWLCKFVPSINE